MKNVLEGVPTLPERVRIIRDREASKRSGGDNAAQNEAISQQECAGGSFRTHHRTPQSFRSSCRSRSVPSA